MDNLVTDAAVEEVAKILVREQSSGLCTFGEECFNCDCHGAKDRDRYALLHSRLALETASPHIAAEALRQASDQLGKFEKESSRDGYVLPVSAAVSYLSGKADELERQQ